MRKEGPIQMMAPVAHDTNPVISHTGLSEMLVEPLRQPELQLVEEAPSALGWMQEQPASGYENLSLLEPNPYSIVNVTREYPFECAMIMFGYIMPFVLVITLITNFLVIVVLSRRHMRTPTNLVLMTMAMVDIGTMASPSPWYLYIYTFGNHDKFLFPPLTCYAHYVMTDVIPIFLHTSSIWLALLLASQRYIYVCHPTLARTWCTKPRVKIAIYTILLVAFLHQSTHFVDNTFKPTRVFQNGKIQDACKNELGSWVKELGENYYYLTYFTFRIFFVFIIPCTALLLLNIALFRALRRAEKKRTELLKRKFKLVGVKSGAGNANANANANANNANESLHLAANDNNQRLQAHENNFSAFNPSSYTLAAQFEKAQSCASAGAAKQQASDIQSTCESISELSERRTRAERKCSARSADLEVDASSRRASSSSSKAEDEEGDEEEEEEEESELGDESTCAECAALRRDSPTWRRCSEDETETTTARERHQHGQPGSQCSSILGGATNEEDVSSLTTNLHHRCPNGSVFGRSESGGGQPRRRNSTDDSGEEAELNLSLNSTTSGERRALAEKLHLLPPVDQGPANKRLSNRELATQKVADETGLIKSSSSAESRLAQCGCLSGQAKALRRVRMLSKSKLKSVRAEASSKRRATGQPAACTRPGAAQAANDQTAAPTNKLAVGDRLAKLPSEQRPHSFHSFVQVRVEPQQAAESGAKSSEQEPARDFRKRLFVPAGRRTKSPSFASSMGRASRASLAGSSAAVGPPLAHAPAVCHQQSGRTMDSNRTTLMLIVVVTVFLIVEVPVAVVTIIHVVLNSFDVFQNVDINSTLNYIKLFTNFFIMLSYSINFTIYCSMSKKFRETFRDLFFWGKFKRKRSARMLYQTQAQPNEYTTVKQAAGASNFNSLAHRALASPLSFVPADHQLAGSGQLVASSGRTPQRSNSLKPIRMQREAGNHTGRLEEGAERQQCGSAMYSDYLATATTTLTTLTTLDPRSSMTGQHQHQHQHQPVTSNGRLADNTSASSSHSSANISSSGTPAAPPAKSTAQARRLSPPALISNTTAAIKQRCKSMLNGGQLTLSARPRCQL